jgi:hypothetical protein
MRNDMKLSEVLQHKPEKLFHGTSESAKLIMKEGLKAAYSDGAIFLTDNPELAIEYAESDQERTDNDDITLVSVKVSSLDESMLQPDTDHTMVDTWQESLDECDQCIYVGDIPAKLLHLEETT